MRIRSWLVVLTVGTIAPAFVSSSVAACDMKAWRQAIQEYQHQHPRAEAADLYKLVHQGIMGSEHAVTDTAAASAWMRREVAALSTSAGRTVEANMVEPLPPDGRFVRVHLRPFLAAGGDPAALVRAFVATANGTKGDTTQFACVERVLSGKQAKDPRTQLLSLIRERRKTGFDAAHHSAAFEAAYAPAYRVIRSLLADSLRVRSGRPARRD